MTVPTLSTSNYLLLDLLFDYFKGFDSIICRWVGLVEGNRLGIGWIDFLVLQMARIPSE